MQTLLRYPYSPRVQSHASTSERTLKIPNTGSHTVVGTDGNTAHTDRMGSAAPAAAVHAIPKQGDPREKEVLKTLLTRNEFKVRESLASLPP